MRKLVSKQEREQERDSKREMREGEKAKISQVDFTTVADPSEWL